MFEESTLVGITLLNIKGKILIKLTTITTSQKIFFEKKLIQNFTYLAI